MENCTQPSTWQSNNCSWISLLTLNILIMFSKTTTSIYYHTMRRYTKKFTITSIKIASDSIKGCDWEYLGFEYVTFKSSKDTHSCMCGFIGSTSGSIILFYASNFQFKWSPWTTFVCVLLSESWLILFSWLSIKSSIWLAWKQLPLHHHSDETCAITIVRYLLPFVRPSPIYCTRQNNSW